ncbi:MAG: alanine racemase [Verrucomicrobiota bacterium]
MTPQSYYRCWVEVDLDAIRHNVAAIRQHIGPGKKLMAVVKADAYGHGLAQVAGTLMRCGVDALAVANLTEALLLRQIGGPGWPILLFGSALPFELEKIVEQNITPTISTFDEARALDAAAERMWERPSGRNLAASHPEGRSHKISVHVEIDTGMGRVGFWHEDAGEAIRQITALPHLQIEALYTHFPSADENLAETRRQLTAFLKIADHRYLLHAANSAALLNLPEAHLDLVRPGLLLYGISPSVASGPDATPTDFRPALSFKARVVYVKDLAAGRSVSYGQTFVATKPMKIATIAAGYADGFSRSLSNNAHVLIAGQRCPVVGRVTMDQIMIDVTDLADVNCGDEAVFIGRQGNGEISASEVAGWEETIAWEVLCGITKTARVPRIYRGASAA